MADEKFTIKEILDYPDKVFTSLSGISLEGILKYVGNSREVKGTKGTFFSQFIVIEDDTGKIGADKSGDAKADLFPESAKGRQVMVEGAKTKMYPDKDKVIQRKLTRGKITLSEQSKGESKDTSGVAKKGYDQMVDGRSVVSREEWARKDRTLTRVAIVKSMIEAGKKPVPDAIDEADEWFSWIYYTEGEADTEKPKEKPKEKTKSSTSKSSVKVVMDKDFDRKKEETKLLKLYTQACTLKLFDANYDLSKWMYEQFEKKTVGSLADDQVADAVRLMGEMVKEKESKK